MTPAVQSEDATPAYSAQWIYDTLMAEIEPDLTSENIVKLDEKYRDEHACREATNSTASPAITAC